MCHSTVSLYVSLHSGSVFDIVSKMQLDRQNFHRLMRILRANLGGRLRIGPMMFVMSEGVSEREGGLNCALMMRREAGFGPLILVDFPV